MTSAEQTQEAYSFKAEIKQLLHILVHSLYQDRDIFLRELISNASDALTRMHFEMLTNKEVLDPEAELAVWIETGDDETDESGARTIVVKDSGVGMSRDELITNLGTIAQSGAREFLAAVKKETGAAESGDNGAAGVVDIIGQFGVGFYSVFMVADEVRVVSRSYQPDAEAAAWVSTGDESFRIEPAEKADRGTEIHITLKKDAEEFAQALKLKQVIKKHSDFVSFPIYVDGEQANQQQSLWRQNPSDVGQEEYEKFYQQMTLDFEPPTAVIHFTADVPINVRALLFIPSRREKSVLAARKEPGLKLYSHNVLIQEYCTDLLPQWLNFVDGVVDSEDLPLNVSRETIQNNRLMRHLGKVVRGRVLRRLTELAEREPEKYADFWQEFSRAFKEGLAIDPGSREDILPLLRFYSSKSGDELTSLADYAARMAPEQEAIYYVLGDDRASVRHSPHLDPFKARDLEVLYLVDPLDAFITPLLGEFQEKPFKNVDDPDLELPELEEPAAEEQPEPAPIDEAAYNRFIGRCVTTLGERVTEVRTSKVLKDSPVRLVAPDNSPHTDYQRVARFLEQNYEVPKRIFEVNRGHPLIANLARVVADRPDSPLVGLAIEQLYASALMQEGLHPNPSEMLPRVQQLLELAAAQEAEQGA